MTIFVDTSEPKLHMHIYIYKTRGISKTIFFKKKSYQLFQHVKKCIKIVHRKVANLQTRQFIQGAGSDFFLLTFIPPIFLLS